MNDKIAVEAVQAEIDLMLYDDNSGINNATEFIEATRTGDGIKTSLGRITFMEEGYYLDNLEERRAFFVFKIGRQTYRITGWVTSWGGSAFDLEHVEEVVQQAVTRYEYLPIGNGNGNTNRV